MEEIDAIEQAVQRYFRSLTEPDRDPSIFATGRVADALRITGSLTGLPKASAVRVEIHDLVVQAIREDEADVALAATVTREFRGRFRTHTEEIPCSGPLLAVRESGEWKVADYRIAGRSASESFRPLDGTAGELGALRIVPRAIDLENAQTFLLLHVTNTGLTSVALDFAAMDASSGRFVPPLDVGSFSATRFEPGADATVVAGWPTRVDLDVERLHFLLRAEDTVTKKGSLCRLRITPSSGTVFFADPAPKRVPPALWVYSAMSRLTGVQRPTWFFTTPLVALALWVIAGPIGAGAALVAFGVFMLTAILRWPWLGVPWGQIARSGLLTLAFIAAGIAAFLFATGEDAATSDDSENGHYFIGATRSCLDAEGLDVSTYSGGVTPGSQGNLVVAFASYEVYLHFGEDASEAEELERTGDELARLGPGNPPDVARRNGNVMYSWGGSEEPSDDVFEQITDCLR
jgi:hypothetical protein